MDQVNYDNLYYDKEIKVQDDKIKPYPIELSIEIRDFHGVPDCKIGHFGYNFYFRTNAGLNRHKYSSRGHLESAVERCLRDKGFKIIEWIEKN